MIQFRRVLQSSYFISIKRVAHEKKKRTNEEVLFL